MSTLIFDIGRTNKKAYVFGEADTVQWETSIAFADVTDDDGVPADDLAAICAWIDDVIDETVAGFGVSAINFSSYGATLVHLDREGKPTTPLYSYLKDVTIPKLHLLYRAHDGPRAFHAITGSPSLGMLNSGLQLLWLQQLKPEAFAATRDTLHLPQYLSYRLTGRVASEYTSVGCHTCLWDFGRRRYHAWLAEAHMYRLLPKVETAYSASRIKLQGRDVIVGLGIHDSSAALLAHRERTVGPFMLISTGTWAINFNPENASPLTSFELGRDCLMFLDPEGAPIKASRLFFGREHDVRVAELSRYHGVHPELYKVVRYNKKIDTKGEAPRFVWTELAAPFRQRQGIAKADGDFNVAYHRLMRELVDLLTEQIKLVATEPAVQRLVIDGGFAQSEVFREMLASNFPKSTVLAATQPIGSALGALAAIQRAQVL